MRQQLTASDPDPANLLQSGGVRRRGNPRIPEGIAPRAALIFVMLLFFRVRVGSRLRCQPNRRPRRNDSPKRGFASDNTDE
jgi:hypothetical protein